MRKIVLIIVILASFISCKKKEQVQNSENHCLFGKWKLYAMYGGCDNGTNNNGDIANFDEFLSLHNDYTYTIDNGISIITDDVYSISNDTIVFNSNSGVKRYIYILNGSELKLNVIDYHTGYSAYLYKHQ